MEEVAIFDIDGTLVESSLLIEEEHSLLLKELSKKMDIGICGGGTFEKAVKQMNDLVYFKHYFTECGCVYYENQKENQLDCNLVYKKNLTEHILFPKIQILIKFFLSLISNVDYDIAGHFVDLRNGIIYLSCVGMQADNKTREKFIHIDKAYHTREMFISQLKKKANQLNILNQISINIGGSVGIALYPNEYDKVQIVDILTKKYKKIYYFGDKYEKNGNDFNLINHPNVIGVKVDKIEDTYAFIKSISSTSTSTSTTTGTGTTSFSS